MRLVALLTVGQNLARMVRILRFLVDVDVRIRGIAPLVLLVLRLLGKRFERPAVTRETRLGRHGFRGRSGRRERRPECDREREKTGRKTETRFGHRSLL